MRDMRSLLRLITIASLGAASVAACNSDPTPVPYVRPDAPPNIGPSDTISFSQLADGAIVGGPQ